MKARLLLIVNDPAFFLSHRLPIARAAKAKGIDVHVATPDEQSSEQICSEGFTFHPIHLSKHGKNPTWEIAGFLNIYKLLRRLNPDIVHLVTIKPVLYGGIAARLSGVPAVVSAVTGMGALFTTSGPRIKFLRRLAVKAYKSAFRHVNQIVIFQNPDDMNYCINGQFLDKEKAVLIKGSGVNVNLFSPQRNFHAESVVLLGGRMLREKGVEYFVEAARLLHHRNLSARFVLAGRIDSWNKSSISEQQLQTWHDEGCIEWWGNRDNMPEVLARTTVACLPSFYGEGVPKFLIEAAACGCPIVTTDTPGCREIVHDGENGILVPARNAEALADAIEKLLKDEMLRASMGQAGRKLAVREFSQEKVIKETLAVYEDLLVHLAEG